jgi:hypothetical protein
VVDRPASEDTDATEADDERLTLSTGVRARGVFQVTREGFFPEKKGSFPKPARKLSFRREFAEARGLLLGCRGVDAK